MSAPEKTVVATGIAGNLGVRLLREIPDFTVFGLDMNPVRDQAVLSGHPSFRFQTIDLGEEPSCRELIDLLRKSGEALREVLGKVL